MTLDSLKCLAIRQPWAWAVCIGAKDVENRTWSTEYRGPLAIQASAAKQEVNARVKESKGKLDAGLMAFGAIIGVVDLVDVSPLSQSLENNPWATGPYCWRFANGRLIDESIPYKGSLHLYELPEAIANKIRQQLSTTPRPGSKSAQAWLAAAQLDPFEMNAERCMSYRDLKDGPGMERAASEMIRLRPNSSDAYRLRGAGRFFGGDAIASLPDYLEAIRLDPKDANAHYLLAWAYRDTGAGDKSAAHWKTAKVLDPETPELE